MTNLSSLSYPVVLLWGLTPPLLALRLRQQASLRRPPPSALTPGSQKGVERGEGRTAGPDALLRLLAILSGTMVITCAARDGMRLCQGLGLRLLGA